MIINTEKYPWLENLDSPLAVQEIARARQQYQETGAIVFPNFITNTALQECVADAQKGQDEAFTTTDVHTAYLKRPNTTDFDASSIYNLQMQTKVASIAFDELSPPTGGTLAQLYRHPTLLKLVSRIVDKQPLYLSDDPLGCCSINVFRPRNHDHHSFHFDESEFSTTLMLQEADDLKSGLFQYTPPLRESPDDLCLAQVASAIQAYDERYHNVKFQELQQQQDAPPHHTPPPPELSTLDFRPGTLSIFSGSRSLHRVTRVRGNVPRLVAVLTFATTPGFCNSVSVQKLFWGRSSTPTTCR